MDASAPLSADDLERILQANEEDAGTEDGEIIVPEAYTDGLDTWESRVHALRIFTINVIKPDLEKSKLTAAQATKLLNWFHACMLVKGRHFYNDGPQKWHLNKRAAATVGDQPARCWESHSCPDIMMDTQSVFIDRRAFVMDRLHLFWLWHLLLMPKLLDTFTRRADGNNMSPTTSDEIASPCGTPTYQSLKGQVTYIHTVKHGKADGKFIIGATGNYDQRTAAYFHKQGNQRTRAARREAWDWGLHWTHGVILAVEEPCPKLIPYIFESLHIFLSESHIRGLNVNPVDTRKWPRILTADKVIAFRDRLEKWLRENPAQKIPGRASYISPHDGNRNERIWREICGNLFPSSMITARRPPIAPERFFSGLAPMATMSNDDVKHRRDMAPSKHQGLPKAPGPSSGRVKSSSFGAHLAKRSN